MRRFEITYVSVLGLFLFGISAASASATTYYVNDATGNDAWDGLCEVWNGGTCGPKKTIQAGINASASGDEVVIAPGTYTGPGNYNISLGSRDIILRSENPDDSSVIASTVVDGQWQKRIFYLWGDSLTPSAEIRGLTIRRGSAAPSGIAAGGILLYESHPTIAQCVFEANIGDHQGGAVSCLVSDPVITNCIFVGNTDADTWGSGGAIHCSTGNPQIINCTFVGNGARQGGGIAVLYSSSPVIRNCIFWNNGAAYPDSSQILVDSSTPAINYCDVQDGTGHLWFGSGCIDVDPRLTAGGRLTCGSPCIEAGTAIGAPPADIDGEPRPADVEVDIGADEWVDSDGDCLPDCWEQKHFGSVTGAVPTEDPDNDDLNNLGEYEAATNPNDSDTDEDYWNDGMEVERGANAFRANIYVDDINGDDIFDGRSPEYVGGTTGPKQTIQSGILAAGAGETVVIRPGTYSGSANYNLDPSYGLAAGARNITIQSEDPFDPGVVAATIIDPQDAGRAFYVGYAYSPLLFIRGLTLRNGLAGVSTPGGASGGAILCSLSNPHLEYLIIDSNATSATGSGGGISCIDSNPSITRCDMTGNTALQGGAINLEGSSPQISECVIQDNDATENGGGIRCGAGSWTTTSPCLWNCQIAGNSAAQEGGGIHSEYSRPLMVNCLIVGNVADRGAGIYSGWQSDDVRMTNCTFSWNTATSSGGGIYCYGSSTVSTAVHNSIIWQNDPQEIRFSSGALDVSYSDIRGGWAGEGNIDADPLFVDPDGADDIPGTEDDDLRLSSGSPCIDAADNTAVFVASGSFRVMIGRRWRFCHYEAENRGFLGLAVKGSGV